MKKISLPKFLKSRTKSPEAPSRITNETVAEHRERIIAGGRRFKYPVQYARHKLVINAVVIVFISFTVLILIGMQQLYFAQNSSAFMYRITQILPLPVATVAGEPVRFSDYLVQYRGLENYLSKYDEIKIDSPDGQAQLNHYKRESLDKAIAESYAAKLARQLGITVTDKDVDAVVRQQLNTVNGTVSQETYDASSLMMYGWSRDEYRHVFQRSLVRIRVAYAVDTIATDKTKSIDEQLKAGRSFDDIIAAEKDTSAAKITKGTINLLSVSSSFNGLAASDIAKLSVGQTSARMQSTTGDGYYYVKLTAKTEAQVSFDYIHVPLTVFDAQLANLKKTGQIHEFIKLAQE